jgi:hypothetical protein
VVIVLMLDGQGSMVEKDLVGTKAFNTYQECLTAASLDVTEIVMKNSTVVAVSFLCQEKLGA